MDHVKLVPLHRFVPHARLPETTLYVPLQLVLQKPGLALPLIALQYHEVKINVDLRPLDECLWLVKNLAKEAVPLKT